MKINERIKFLRKELALTQNDFGERVGLKKSAISQIENGSTSANPRIIQLICNAFGVSERWLVKGEGKMYSSDEDAILEKLSNMYDLTPEQEIFARHWLQLPPDAREAVVDYVVGVVESIKENQDATSAKIAHDGDTKKDAPCDASAQAADSPPVAVFKSPAQQVTGKLPANGPQDSTAQQAADAGRPDNITDKEWEVLQMIRLEEKKGLSASPSNASAERA